MTIDQKILKGVLLMRATGAVYLSKEEQLADITRWTKESYFTEADMDAWIDSLKDELAKSPEQREAESAAFIEELCEYEAREAAAEAWGWRYTSSTARDYGPSNPWDAPGMSVSDFI